MQDMPQHRTEQGSRRANRRVALACVAVFCGMVAISFAAVPLYRIFCQVTGFGGPPQIASATPDMSKREAGEIYVRFDANVAAGLDWHFQPVQRVVKVKLGEPVLVHYRATNRSDHDIVGTASYNVTPDAAGYFFNKIACFCFTEQKLAAGESIDMPVTFFVDPDIADDLDARNISTITLSYTFFPKANARLSRNSGETSQANPG